MPVVGRSGSGCFARIVSVPEAQLPALAASGTSSAFWQAPAHVVRAVNEDTRVGAGGSDFSSHGGQHAAVHLPPSCLIPTLSPSPSPFSAVLGSAPSPLCFRASCSSSPLPVSSPCPSLSFPQASFAFLLSASPSHTCAVFSLAAVTPRLEVQLACEYCTWQNITISLNLSKFL